MATEKKNNRQSTSCLANKFDRPNGGCYISAAIIVMDNAIKRQRRQDKKCQERYNIHWISVWFLTSVQMFNCIGNNIRLQATKKYIFYNSAGTKEELFP